MESSSAEINANELAPASKNPNESARVVNSQPAQNDNPSESITASSVQNNIDTSENVTLKQTLDTPAIAGEPALSDKTSNHESISVAEISSKSTIHEVEVIGSSDNEDIITVYTGQEDPKSDQAISSATSLPPKIDTRPDYSSTTSESDDNYSAYANTKFFLESDVPYPDSHSSTIPQGAVDLTKAEGLSVLDRSTYGESYADVATYLRCTRCVRLHISCDRKLPHCSKCTSIDECVYPKRDGRPVNVVMKKFTANETPQNPDRAQNATATKHIEKTEKPIRIFSTKPNPVTGVKAITWIDGDVEYSRKECPKYVVKQIERHLEEFESTVAASLWPKIKTCYYDCGRALMFIDELTDREVPVARYKYGDRFQFFVVWYPKEDDKLVPAIFRFKVYKNDPPTPRNGKNWKPVHWHTWVARGTHHRARVIIRYIEDKQPNTHFVPPQEPEGKPLLIGSNQSDLVEIKSGSPPGKRRLQDYGWSSASDGDDDIPSRPHSIRHSKSVTSISSSTKRRRESSITSYDLDESSKRPKHHSWSDHPNWKRERESNGRFSSAKATEASLANATRSSTRTAAAPLNRNASNFSSLGELARRKKLDVTCVFKDKVGVVKGVYTFDECDTAQKLFDVACVAQIAQVEPPATRLLKIDFEGGGEGRVRPDNDKDYDHLFQTELKRLADNVRRVAAVKVIISPYL